MNKLTIPSSPNWYESDIMACAPDNTLLYGSRQDLVVIKPTPLNEPDNIQVITKAHSMKIISVNINRKWGEPHKHTVTVSEDKIIKVWDIEKMEKITSHNKHISDSSKIVGASFAGDDRIISTSETGSIVVYNIVKNESNIINSLFNKTTITCLSVCPHATWLAAFGLKNGLVVIADLRRTGKILYNLRGHSKSIVSLVWCPVPVNIFPMKPNNKVVEKLSEEKQLEINKKKVFDEKFLEDEENLLKIDPNSDVALDDKFSKNDTEKSNRRKQKSPKKEPNPWTECYIAEDHDNKPKTPKRDSKIADFLSKNEILESSGSSQESHQFCSASSCETDLYCLKRNKDTINLEENETKELENDVFYDAQNQEKSENWRTTVSLDEQPRKEYLLASSAREPSIYVWRAGTDGRLQTFMKIPSPKNTKYQKKTKESLPWITLCWPTPKMLLSASKSAELLQWTLPKPMAPSTFVRTIHRDHWSVLFSIKAPIFYLNQYNFLQERSVNVWTTGMERHIINTDLVDMKNLALYPAFGGSVNCLDGSPLDPNRLAIGTGEGLIHIWDLSRPHKKSIILSNFYHQVLSSVTSLAWHPVLENILAWGTVEGRVGVLDLTNKSRQPKIFKQFFKSQIFKLEWGPADKETGKHKLFVVSESKVAIFDTDSKESKENDPEMLQLPDNTSVFTMAWKPDYSMLLISTKSGMIITYTPDLELENVSYISNKLQSIKWHPDAVSNNVTESKYCKTFVSQIKHTEILIFDLNVNKENYDDKIIAKFENRSVRICSLAWSPHSGNFLVFVDDYGVAQVFDIESKNIISTYISPSLDQLLCVHWSPLDPDFIITGTISHKIVVWPISENPALPEKEINARKNKILKALQKEVGDLLVKEKVVEKVEEKAETSKNKVSNKSEIVPQFYIPKTGVADLQKLLQNKLGNESFEVSMGDVSKTLDVLDVFGIDDNMERVFEINLRNFKKQGQFKKANLLGLVQGDISGVIKEAIEQNRVDPWIISVCPMVSPKLWQTACDTYVHQLIDQPEADPFEIVTYMLACHKIEESVKFLCERQLYREAFVLAKGRFGKNNPITSQVVDEWGKKLAYQGNFELAACCYISIGKYSEAASVLFRRSNVEILKLAVELAKVAENDELHKAIVSRLNAFKIEEDKNDVSEPKINTDNDLLKELENFDKNVQETLESQDKLASDIKKCVDEIEIKKVQEDTKINKEPTLQEESKELIEKLKEFNVEEILEIAKEPEKTRKEQIEEVVKSLTLNPEKEEKMEELIEKSQETLFEESHKDIPKIVVDELDEENLEETE